MSGERGSNDPPILGYAAIPVQGSPQWHAVLGEMIEASASPRDIRPYFTSDLDTLSYFAVSMSRRYSDQKVAGPCLICSAEPARKTAVLVWAAEIFYRTFEFVLSTSPQLHFKTHHPICDDCADQWVRRRRVLLYLVLISVAAGIAIFGWIWHLYKADPDAIGLVVFAGIVGPLVLGYLYLKFQRAGARRVRTQMPQGVKLVQIRRVSARKPAGGAS